MRHGDPAPVLNLPKEGGHDAAAATQDVSEAGRDEVA
jgi:hypothetical protein